VRVGDLEIGIWNLEFGIADCGFPRYVRFVSNEGTDGANAGSNSKFQIPNSKFPISKFPISKFQFPISNFPIPISTTLVENPVDISFSLSSSFWKSSTFTELHISAARR
jgi:hypothetical protein